MKNSKLFALLFALVTVQALAAARTEPLNSPDGTGGIRFNNAYEQMDQHEVVPPGGVFMWFMHGPDSTFFVMKTAAGKGRSLKVNINRHNEETGIVIKGSVLFKSGYNGEFEHVLRAGDTIIIPKCMPHSGMFAWDADEETILVTTFTDKYKEYGPDNLDKPSAEFVNKLNSKQQAKGPSTTEECRNMKGLPKVTWTLADIPTPPPLPKR